MVQVAAFGGGVRSMVRGRGHGSSGSLSGVVGQGDEIVHGPGGMSQLVQHPRRGCVSGCRVVHGLSFNQME